MALLKEKPVEVNSFSDGQRNNERDYNGLLKELESRDVTERRWAARDLASCPDACGSLLAALHKETVHAVREAIYDSLNSIGG